MKFTEGNTVEKVHNHVKKTGFKGIEILFWSYIATDS